MKSDPNIWGYVVQSLAAIATMGAVMGSGLEVIGAPSDEAMIEEWFAASNLNVAAYSCVLLLSLLGAIASWRIIGWLLRK